MEWPITLCNYDYHHVCLIDPLDKNPLNQRDLVNFEELSLRYSSLQPTSDNYSRQPPSSAIPPAEVVTALPQSGELDAVIV
jgi:hypothetical protein